MLKFIENTLFFMPWNSRSGDIWNYILLMFMAMDKREPKARRE